ncbi:hypothetical protein GCM10025879_06710 [Leuconostoc litchii]|uniref:DUF1934 domain-containing protein n=1 Tax=Leuconostoc litchii TaxID=1981069 RepID=A0A6P2CNA2_9LACO|nr:DUF1934 domain-containing protein [Leuconostoc litchii]TYC47410.1 DUF1934 domain-containing protein [Leuconostoc litchii]GMA69425.1 hypothetical protein GCM10025879_06710 [Leuconostoc litchii]
MAILEQNDVEIHLKTKIRQENEIERFDFQTTGKLFLKNNALYLRYTEVIEDQKTQIMFKFSDGQIRMNRSGDIITKFSFVKSERIPALYQTPTGQMQLETLTTLLATDFDLKKLYGEVAIDYILYANQQVIGQYEVRLQFTPESSMID